jgi:hypothetical protein
MSDPRNDSPPAWQPTFNLRWLVKLADQDTKAPILQQQWIDVASGNREWRPLYLELE